MTAIRRVLGPRPWVLLSIAALKLAVIVVIAYFIVGARANSQHESQKRFTAAAKISAALTSSLFDASEASSAEAAAKQFGDTTVSAAALDRAVARQRQRYELILDSRGKILAASKGTPAFDRSPAYATTHHVRTALAGRSELSDVIGTGPRSVIEWAVPFKTAHGTRVLVTSVDAPLIARFLGGYLARTKTTSASQA